MSRPPFFGLRSRLILLVLLAVIPALVLTFYRTLEEKKMVADQVKQEQLRLVRFISHNQSQLIENTRHLLYVLAQLPQVRSCDPSLCSQIFADLLKQFPWYLNIGAAYPDGRLFASALLFEKPVNIADRSYFQLAMSTRSFAVGEYQIGRITGKASINFGYPIISDKGEVKGVIYAALNVDWLNKLSVGINLPSGSSVFLIDHNATVLAHYPDPEKWVGKVFKEIPMLKTILSEREGTVEGIGIDGLRRFYTFTSFSHPGQIGNVHLVVGAPKEVVFARVDEIANRNVIFLIIIGGIALLVAWVLSNLLVLQRLKPLRSVFLRIRTGQIDLREKMDSAKDEINQLSAAFDEMANSLEMREVERKRAEATLRESERRYRELANLLPGIVFEADEKGNLTFASKKAFEIMGYSPQDMEAGLNVFQFISLPELEKAKDLFIEALKGEQGNFSFTLQRRDGSTFPALIHTSPIFKDGNPAGLRGIAIDITNLKQIEENLRKSEDTARSLVHESEIIAEIGRIISSTPNIEEIYEKFAKKIMELINFDRIAISIINPIERVFSIPYVWGSKVLEREVGRVLPLARTGAEWVMKNRKSLLVSEENKEEIINQCPGLLPAFQRGFRSMILCPLFSKDQIIGTLNIQTFAANAYGEKDLRIMERVSYQIAGAIANALLFEEQKRTEEALRKREEESKNLAEENALLAEIGRIISSTLNIDEVYEGFAREVKKLIPFEKISINIVDFETNMVNLLYVAGKSVPGRDDKDVFPLAGSFAEAVISQKKGMFYHPFYEEEVAKKFPGLLPVYRAGLKSILTVPLISRDKSIGTLNFMAESPQAYSDEHLRLAERVANQIAGAVTNALLFEEHQRAAKEKALLHEQLIQSQKMEAVGRLAGGIAHDFNNSLTLVKVSAQLAQMELKEGDPLLEKINAIIEATDRSANLARQLLAFSRRQVMEMKVIDINALIKDLDKMLHRVIGEDIELIYRLAEDLRKVKVDPGQIEQVILNLTLNSRDAMPKGGKLIIETMNVELDENYVKSHLGAKAGQYVLLSVTDTGIGMTPEVKEHLFEPFFTTKEKGKGTGLGLSTAYGIVKQSGGDIWVYSEVGQGTTFKIYLPAVDEPAEEIRRKEVGAVIFRGDETILLVEDEEEVRKLAVMVLQRLGYKVLIASCAEEAFDICDQHKEPIHLLLTDVIMPGMSGRALAEGISTLRPDIKVLYMSGYPDEIIADHGILKPGINYLPKPFTVEGLAMKVRDVLDKAKAREKEGVLVNYS